LTSRRRSGSDEEGRSLGSFVSVVSPAAPGQGTVTGRGRTLEDPSAPHRRHVATGEVDLDRDGGVTGEAGADEPGDPWGNVGPRISRCASSQPSGGGELAWSGQVVAWSVASPWIAVVVAVVGGDMGLLAAAFVAPVLDGRASSSISAASISATAAAAAATTAAATAASPQPREAPPPPAPLPSAPSPNLLSVSALRVGLGLGVRGRLGVARGRPPPRTLLSKYSRRLEMRGMCPVGGCRRT
jgi:hypothetical protein